MTVCFISESEFRLWNPPGSFMQSPRAKVQLVTVISLLVDRLEVAADPEYTGEECHWHFLNKKKQLPCQRKYTVVLQGECQSANRSLQWREVCLWVEEVWVPLGFVSSCVTSCSVKLSLFYLISTLLVETRSLPWGHKRSNQTKLLQIKALIHTVCVKTVLSHNAGDQYCEWNLMRHDHNTQTMVPLWVDEHGAP
jgi:hypothetical protein